MFCSPTGAAVVVATISSGGQSGFLIVSKHQLQRAQPATTPSPPSSLVASAMVIMAGLAEVVVTMSGEVVGMVDGVDVAVVEVSVVVAVEVAVLVIVLVCVLV